MRGALSLWHTLNTGRVMAEQPWTLLDNSMAGIRWRGKDKAARGFRAIDSAYLSGRREWIPLATGESQ